MYQVTVSCDTTSVRKRWTWRIFHVLRYFHVWHKCILNRPQGKGHDERCICKCTYAWDTPWDSFKKS